MTSKNAFHYHDYRLFLHDWFWTSKQNNPKVSFRFISRYLSLKAPNHFHLVISQKRNLSLGVLEKMIRLMKLSPVERQFLKLLFKENTAKTPKAKADANKQIDLFRKQGLQTRTANYESKRRAPGDRGS